MTTSPLPDLPAGVYRHYKGPVYLVLGYAHDANVPERTAVIYVGLQLDSAHTGPRLAVRTAEDFLRLVHRDGSPCEGEVCQRQYDGSGSSCDLQRFTYLAPTWDGIDGE